MLCRLLIYCVDCQLFFMLVILYNWERKPAGVALLRSTVDRTPLVAAPLPSSAR